MYAEIVFGDNDFTIYKQTQFSKVKCTKRVMPKTIKKLDGFFDDTPVVSKCDYKSTEITSMIIPDNKTIIGDLAFHSYSHLTNVTLPSKLEKIGFKAFLGCIRMREITIPDNVTIIDELAFSGCTFLKQIKLPDNIKSIGKKAFNCCEYLVYIEYNNVKYYEPEEFNEKMKELGIAEDDIWLPDGEPIKHFS